MGTQPTPTMPPKQAGGGVGISSLDAIAALNWSGVALGNTRGNWSLDSNCSGNFDRSLTAGSTVDRPSPAYRRLALSQDVDLGPEEDDEVRGAVELDRLEFGVYEGEAPAGGPTDVGEGATGVDDLGPNEEEGPLGSSSVHDVVDEVFGLGEEEGVEFGPVEEDGGEAMGVD
ncbi:hypothetical protein Clacol_002657 [Clathrus columnatus]|uniref:Uncharacterized protein n=1 Tax=Clathrus columnatus TaxID=1419009 RepID=A0AAV5A608_9AGAM|nr:hypothetical protein Clacol_002657 [Clathrus columnatus]